ncbi:MAG TPA: glycoside hydrolase family 3 N-terminal domain-containing protein [Pyrinomonadaceae bacterium]|nr:glycoside hydrolase family 3 N-terminal domain-containing protein [Pyrinomonadaceae bacterium]
MRRHCLSILILLLANLSHPQLFAQSRTANSTLSPDKKAYKWADKMLPKMSLDEKIGQLVHIGVNARFANRDSRFFLELKRQVVENKIGGIIFFGAPIYETVILGNRLQELAKVPLLFSLDAETGVGMRFEDAENFPWAMAVTATGDIDLARKMGEITGKEAKALGMRHIYAPVLDVNNNAANPVINVRSFGEDPEDVARFGVAFMLGLQSEGIIATAKHFPGHGDTNIDSHRGLPVIDLPMERLNSVELVPFKKAIDAGIGSVMIGHIALPKVDPEIIKPLKDYRGGDAEAGSEIVSETASVPATLSKIIQTDLLRSKLGFQGLIVSDAMSMSGLTLYFTQEEAGVRALLAGTDILEKPSDPDAMLKGIKTAVESGRLPIERINESVRRQLAWKYAVGLEKNRLTNLDKIDLDVSGRESVELSNTIADRSITLVKNEAGVLPINNRKKIAVIGISNGFDGPQTMAPFLSTLRAGQLKFQSQYLQENSSDEQYQNATKLADTADILIFGLYGRVRSGAKNSVGIPQKGADILSKAISNGKTVIVISFGNPYILLNFPDVKTYIVAYGEMRSLQNAAARAILGLNGFYGRLPISLPGLYPRGSGIRLEPTAK